MLDTTTSLIEHPELVAQRPLRYASVVGRDGVIVGESGLSPPGILALPEPERHLAREVLPGLLSV